MERKRDQMKKQRILVVSSSNMDFVMKVGKMPEAGQTVTETRGYSYVPGGKGANAAMTFAKLGADCIFCAKLGNDQHAQRLKKLYDDCGIDTRFVTNDRNSPTGLAAIVVEDNGANRIVCYPGSNSSLGPDDVEDAFTTLPDAVFVQLEVPEEAVVAAAEQAKRLGVPLFVDAGPARRGYPIDRLAPIEILSPNETETFALTGVMPNNSDNCLLAASELMRMTQAKYVVIKLGGRGAYIHDGRSSQLLSAYECEVVDTTAAGDAFTAALTLEYLNTHDICHSVKYANAVGALVVGRAGASTSIPDAAEVERFIRMRGIRL